MIAKSIIVVMIAFMSMILYFVKTAVNTEFNLVSKSYYQDEALVDKFNAERRNDQTFSDLLTVSQSETALELSFNSPLAVDSISVFFYSPRHPSEDHHLTIPVTGAQEQIPLEKLTNGNWYLTLVYTHKGLHCRRDIKITKG
jgi:nitrogen fixation protein FixH